MMAIKMEKETVFRTDIAKETQMETNKAMNADSRRASKTDIQVAATMDTTRATTVAEKTAC